MSVIATFDIANGSAHRTFKIHNITKLSDSRDPDTVSQYVVERTNSVGGGGYRTASFEHRFGDDVTILVAKAGAALRKKYGNV
ncbi:hypothetical protein MRBLMI12_000481 [Microbacterium sp. LMI12-1-1.1]|uniref:hypothetical protein n=1 Tax=Microbacterium sp. LMI12-1-1.1 TaxID=3135225 RepID=UPI0034186CEB